MSLYQAAGNLWRGPARATPKALFAGAELGGYWEFNDLSSLAQDNAGATPVSAPAQTLGRVLDRSGRGNHLAQATPALRPLWGLGPVSRRNWFLTSEFAAGLAAEGPTKGGLISNAALAGYDGAVAFGYDGATLSYLYKDAAASLTYTMSVVVRMTDGLPPLFGNAAPFNAANSFALNMGNTYPSPLTYVVTDLGGGFYRVSVTALAGGTPNLFGPIKHSANSARTFILTAFQLELGTTLTAYQKTGASSLDITEAGFPAYGFARFDLSNDVLATTFATGFTGDVALFGRSGSRIISGQTFAGGGTLSIGATTATGFAAGTLAAVGDLVGALAISRALTVAERAKVLAYFAAQGAGGWL